MKFSSENQPETKPTTINLSSLKKNWPSDIVARDAIAKFSGKVLHPRSMSNLDSRGEGPPRFYFKRRVFYPIDPLIKWMEQHVRKAVVQKEAPNGNSN